jgi:predicted ribosomally synthesized peptide with SipW-like signal peptide
MKNHYRIVSTLIIAIAVVIGTTVGTYAYFNAKKTFTANKFAAGTLDLDVISSNNINEPINIENVGGSQKIVGNRIWKIRNVGTLPGKLMVNLQNIKNEENGCNAPEIEAEPNCEADNIGELGKSISIKALVNGEVKATSTLATGQELGFAEGILLQPNEEINMEINWAEIADSYGNEIQSDTVNFDMVFRLEQQQ